MQPVLIGLIVFEYNYEICALFYMQCLAVISKNTKKKDKKKKKLYFTYYVLNFNKFSLCVG